MSNTLQQNVGEDDHRWQKAMEADKSGMMGESLRKMWEAMTSARMKEVVNDQVYTAIRDRDKRQCEG